MVLLIMSISRIEETKSMLVSIYSGIVRQVGVGVVAEECGILQPGSGTERPTFVTRATDAKMLHLKRSDDACSITVA